MRAVKVTSLNLVSQLLLIDIRSGNLRCNTRDRRSSCINRYRAARLRPWHTRGKSRALPPKHCRIRCFYRDTILRRFRRQYRIEWPKTPTRRRTRNHIRSQLVWLLKRTRRAAIEIYAYAALPMAGFDEVVDDLPYRFRGSYVCYVVRWSSMECDDALDCARALL